MREFSASLLGLSPDQRARRYTAIARAALDHYALGAVEPVFLQHNSGLAFRVDSLRDRTRFLLKIHEPIGESGAMRAEQIKARLEWLIDLRRATGLVVQEPVPNGVGDLLTSAYHADLTLPFLCTLRQWVDGEHPHGDFTEIQVYHIGVLMARLHDFSGRWIAPAAASIPRYSLSNIRTNIISLRLAINLGVLSVGEYHLLEATGPLIERAMGDLGEQAQVWGPIHSDFHHGNLLLSGDEIHPIDFDALSLAHYYSDLGVTLYHIFYQAPAVRRLLLDGYRSIRHLPEAHLPYLDAFLTRAAIDNLAFQFSISEQRTTRLFAHNLRQLAVEFCGKLIAGQPFAFV
jgi:Ser/Thr protein kinase RdoA (MazF antagonist)